MAKILIVIEIPSREYDNALLLSAILKRKHQVKIVSKTCGASLFFKPDFLIIPNCYNTENLDWYQKVFNASGAFILNLQYEQILNKKKERAGRHIPTGSAKRAYHLCWGEYSKRRLLNAGIDQDHLPITGALQLDLMRESFLPYWKTRQEIAEEYDLRADSKWLLYISGFVYPQNEALLGIQRRAGKDVSAQAVLQAQSRTKMTEWFRKLLDDNPHISVIYRPHPLEWNTEEIRELVKEYPKQFYVIDSLSIRQWITVSDLIITWRSTSVLECAAAGKPFLVARPDKVDPEEDAIIYEGIPAIENGADFVDSIRAALDNQNTGHLIRSLHYHEFVEIEDCPSCMRISNVIDSILNNPDSIRSRQISLLKRAGFLIRKGIIIKVAAKHLYKMIYKKKAFRIKSERLRARYAVDDWERECEAELHEKPLRERMIVLESAIEGKLNDNSRRMLAE